MIKNTALHPFSKKLTKEEINMLPLVYYTGQVYLVQSEAEMEEAYDALMQHSVLGFDTETRPSFKKGKFYHPSLVQLATSNAVYLFHLGRLSMHPLLLDILQAKDMVKTGVAIQDDFKGLAKLHPFTPACGVDLSVIGKKHGIGNLGLRGLAAQFMQVRISKSEQCSNWALDELSERQIRYAATDAWISREIYYHMKRNGFIG